MSKQSAGILLYRNKYQLEVLLSHPGGPYVRSKEKGVWSIPKGEFTDEEPLDAAKREFHEEMGSEVPETEEPYIYLDTVKLSSGKVIHIWAVEGDFDVTTLTSNTFSIEWPPKSGEQQEFPEVDRAEWFKFDKAYTKIHPSQVPFLDRLAKELGSDYSSPVQSSLF